VTSRQPTHFAVESGTASLCVSASTCHCVSVSVTVRNESTVTRSLGEWRFHCAPSLAAAPVAPPPQVLFRNLVFGTPGLPLPHSSLLVEGYRYHGAVTRGVRKTKALFRTKCCPVLQSVDPHKFPVTCGDTVPLPPKVGVMNHYWGIRATWFRPPRGPGLGESFGGLQHTGTVLRPTNGTAKSTVLDCTILYCRMMNGCGLEPWQPRYCTAVVLLFCVAPDA